MYQISKDQNCANDNLTACGDTMLDILAAQDMFSPEKALEIMRLLKPKDGPADMTEHLTFRPT
jgi:hypothetical protein